MKISRLLMVVTAALVFTGGSAFYVSSNTSGSDACEIAGGCGKCGDGYCAKQCGETATTCPRDCGGVPMAK
ncbi:MAG: hypothetical protein ABIU09_00660 [Pyrinomonadaceae bacterium]